MTVNQEGCGKPSWSVQTWKPAEPNVEDRTGEWSIDAYPTLDEAMLAFLESPPSSKARLTLGEEIGMTTDSEDDAVCMFPSHVANMMLDAHERVCQRMLTERGCQTEVVCQAIAGSPAG